MPLVEGSRRWKQIVKRGCSVINYFEGDSDCGHHYPWVCDECPVVIEGWYEKERADKRNWMLSEASTEEERGKQARDEALSLLRR